MATSKTDPQRSLKNFPWTEKQFTNLIQPLDVSNYSGRFKKAVATLNIQYVFELAALNEKKFSELKRGFSRRRLFGIETIELIKGLLAQMDLMLGMAISVKEWTILRQAARIEEEKKLFKDVTMLPQLLMPIEFFLAEMPYLTDASRSAVRILSIQLSLLFVGDLVQIQDLAEKIEYCRTHTISGREEIRFVQSQLKKIRCALLHLGLDVEMKFHPLLKNLYDDTCSALTRKLQEQPK